MLRVISDEESRETALSDGAALERAMQAMESIDRHEPKGFHDLAAAMEEITKRHLNVSLLARPLFIMAKALVKDPERACIGTAMKTAERVFSSANRNSPFSREVATFILDHAKDAHLLMEKIAAVRAVNLNPPYDPTIRERAMQMMRELGQEPFPGRPENIKLEVAAADFVRRFELK